MNNKIIVLCAPSCAGKDTVAKELSEKYGYNFVISTTTRPMRPGESQKNPYNFIDNKSFEKLIKDDNLIEYRKYDTLVDNKSDTWYYGVENTEIELDKEYVCVLDTIGLIEFRKKFGNRVISFFLNADDDIRKNRCRQRGDFDESEWNRRLADDKIRFSNEKINKLMDFSINSNRGINDITNEIYFHILGKDRMGEICNEIDNNIIINMKKS